MNYENVAQNLRESFRVIAASRVGGENRELRGVSIASAGVTFQMFNCAFLSAPVLNEAELTQRMLLANTPVIFLGNAFATRLPLKAIHYTASVLFALLGVVFIVRAAQLWH